MQHIFVTGIGTGIGKTLVSAILVQALDADYWKPVQAGSEPDTDAERIRKWVGNPAPVIHPELYLLKLAASPHIAAREENLHIDLDIIRERYLKITDGMKMRENSTSGGDNDHDKFLIIEGAGGLLVPLNEDEFVLDLIKKLNARVILVSRNYLGSINHSLLTARICATEKISVLGWIFNDQYLNYEEEIVRWSGFPRIASIPFLPNPGRKEIERWAFSLRPSIMEFF